MKKIVVSIFCFSVCFSVMAQSPNSKYDKALADSLGGDDSGMKMYVLVLLKTGTATFGKKQPTAYLTGIWPTLDVWQVKANW